VGMAIWRDLVVFGIDDFLPLLLTGEIDRRTSAASALLPSLMAHLIYDATTALAFLLLENRYTRRLLPNPRRQPTCCAVSAQWERPLRLYGFSR
jgi:hypothetical protein